MKISGTEKKITVLLREALKDPSDKVLLSALEVLACNTQDASVFSELLGFLTNKFRCGDFLIKFGPVMVRRLCKHVDSERVYREFAKILEKEVDFEFTSLMVQVLNKVLLTSSECAELRALLKQSSVNIVGKDMFNSLYSPWCHSSTATISLCLLAQAYQHASAIIYTLREEDIDVKFLAPMDWWIKTLETPSLASLRLQLLEPGSCTWLLNSLNGLLKLFPEESTAFKKLWTRLETVRSYPFGSGKEKDILPISDEVDVTSKLHLFEHIRNKHHKCAKKQQDGHILTSSTRSQVLTQGCNLNDFMGLQTNLYRSTFEKELKSCEDSHLPSPVAKAAFRNKYQLPQPHDRGW